MAGRISRRVAGKIRGRGRRTMLPTITVSAEEQTAGQLAPETVAEATHQFFLQGTLVVRKAFPADLLRNLHAAFLQRYQQYLVHQEHPDALTVGDKRYMVTLDFEPPVDTPLLYANPFISAVVARSLGVDYLMGSFGAVVSLPGSETQHIHRDSERLFSESNLDLILPVYALTLVVPLVSIDDLA